MEPGVVKIHRFKLGIVLNWEMFAELIKVWVVKKKKQKTGYFVQRKKKRRMLVSY